MYISQLLIPILKPSKPWELHFVEQPADYFFYPNTFLFYDYCGETLICDDQQQWYAAFQIQCNTRMELKLNRQILAPHYLQQADLPLVQKLKELELKVATARFDKAFGHVLHYIPKQNELTAVEKMQIANFDGPDDPTISPVMHYIENDFAGEKTWFISGNETRSFATITESSYYAKSIWPQHVALPYLLLFAYYTQYKSCPSDQMMPRFLCNLWASTSAFAQHYNPALFKKMELY